MRCWPKYSTSPTKGPAAYFVFGALGVFLVLLAGASEGFGASQTWDNNTGSFIWNNKGTDKNWTGNKAWVNGNDAIFGSTGVGTIKVDATGTGGTTANSITINTAGYTFTPNAAGDTLTLVGSGLITTNQNVTMSVPLAGSVGLTKAGTSTLTLTGANTYTNATTINAGTLKIDNNNTTTARLANTTGIGISNGGTLLFAQSGVTASTNRINDAANITLNGGGTINTAGLSEGTRPTNSSSTNGAAGLGALTLQITTSVLRATIDFGSGANGRTLALNTFLDIGNQFLDIKNWTGTPIVDNSSTGNDRLLFANSPNLTASQLSNVSFYDDTGALIIMGGQIISYGNMFELVAVPEPSTWVAAALSLLVIAYSQRRRFARAIKRVGQPSMFSLNLREKRN
jgi:autotransporter-associated beta strand protein